MASRRAGMGETRQESSLCGDVEPWQRTPASMGHTVCRLGSHSYRMQKALLDRYDRTRPVTVAMHPRGRNEKTDSLPAPLAMETDVAAYNYRYMYFPGDSRRFPG